MSYRETGETTKVPVDETISIGSNNILNLLESQIANYPSMFMFLRKHIPLPSTILVPQNLKLIDGEITRDSSFLYEALNFLDVVCMFSLQETGNAYGYVDSIIDMLAELRTIKSPEFLLAGVEMSNVIYNTKADMTNLLDNNKVVLSLYIFSMVCNIFYIKDI